MAVDVNSNKYTFVFATILVVVVATLLALASESLKPLQKANVANEKRQNILSTIGMNVSAKDAKAEFEKYVKESMIFDANGQKKATEKDAFDIDVFKDYKNGLSKIYKATANDFEARKTALLKFEKDGADFPLYVLDKDGDDVYVIPMVGTGLWGPVWGYIGVADDGKTIVGAVFDHKTETPGLGAEIAQLAFQKPFEGKTIFDENGQYTGIKVIKGGAKGDVHGVDAISGGTLTSNGVEEMIMRTLKIYEPFLKGLFGETSTESIEAAPDSSNTSSIDTDTTAIEEPSDITTE